VALEGLGRLGKDFGGLRWWRGVVADVEEWVEIGRGGICVVRRTMDRSIHVFVDAWGLVRVYGM
jgi:hypothetical protein